VIVEGVLRLSKQDKEEVRRALRERMEGRRGSQPLGIPSAGSVFKNPPNDSAGRIIEALGLKGFSIGGARVSERHANFIVNAGGATAGDVLGLIREVQNRVVRHTGIHLDLEVVVVGEEP
jgi:UDP-N-acetylmuramate dehydrogenase